MNNMVQRVITASVLLSICALSWHFPILFLIAWLSASVWILTIEWPRLAPWYTGLVYPGSLLAAIWCMYLIPEYRYLVWIGILSAIIFDTGAYTIGRYLGYHYIAPAISPRKTWEGTIGGYTLLYCAACIYMYHIPSIAHPYMLSVLITWLLGTAAFTGDLFVSWMKRKANIKDCSTILPGHGGILDRCDSLIFCIPVVYVFHVSEII